MVRGYELGEEPPKIVNYFTFCYKNFSLTLLPEPMGVYEYLKIRLPYPSCQSISFAGKNMNNGARKKGIILQNKENKGKMTRKWKRVKCIQNGGKNRQKSERGVNFDVSSKEEI